MNNNQNTFAYNQLLAIATEAKGNEPMDSTIPPMSEQDQKWLQEVLKEQIHDLDPVRQMKQILQKIDAISSLLTIENIEQNSEKKLIINNKEFSNLKILVEENLIDLVCDLDLALDFCKLGGLTIIKKFLQNFLSENRVLCLFFALIAELGQYNPQVQEYFVKDEFFLKCFLEIIKNNKNFDEITCYKAIGALSAIVKGYIPGVVKFCRFNGADIIKKCFEEALEMEKEKIVYRITVAIKSIHNSFTENISNHMKIAELLKFIAVTLEKNTNKKFEESLNFLIC